MATQASQRVPALDPNRLMATIDREIKRIGMIAVLRRSTGDRQCWMYFGEWNPRELMGGLIDPTDRLAIVSAVDLAIPPDHTMDRLITFVQPYDPNSPVADENLRILAPAGRINPSGLQIVWKLRVRR